MDRIKSLIAKLDKRDLLEGASGIARKYHATMTEVLAEDRGRQHVAHARAAIMSWMFNEGLTLTSIAELMGRHFTTVRDNIRSHAARQPKPQDP